MTYLKKIYEAQGVDDIKQYIDTLNLKQFVCSFDQMKPICVHLVKIARLCSLNKLVQHNFILRNEHNVLGTEIFFYTCRRKNED